MNYVVLLVIFGNKMVRWIILHPLMVYTSKFKRRKINSQWISSGRLTVMRSKWFPIVIKNTNFPIKSSFGNDPFVVTKCNGSNHNQEHQIGNEIEVIRKKKSMYDKAQFVSNHTQQHLNSQKNWITENAHVQEDIAIQLNDKNEKFTVSRKWKHEESSVAHTWWMKIMKRERWVFLGQKVLLCKWMNCFEDF